MLACPSSGRMFGREMWGAFVRVVSQTLAFYAVDNYIYVLIANGVQKFDTRNHAWHPAMRDITQK